MERRKSVVRAATIRSEAAGVDTKVFASVTKGYCSVCVGSLVIVKGPVTLACSFLMKF